MMTPVELDFQALQNEPGADSEAIHQVWQIETHPRSFYCSLDLPETKLSYRNFLAYYEKIGEVLLQLPTLYALDLLNRAQAEFVDLTSIPPNEVLAYDLSFVEEIFEGLISKAKTNETFNFRTYFIWNYVSQQCRLDSNGYTYQNGQQVCLKEAIILEIKRLIKLHFAVFDRSVKGLDSFCREIYDTHIQKINSLKIYGIAKCEYFADYGPLSDFLGDSDLTLLSAPRYPTEVRKALIYNVPAAFNAASESGMLDSEIAERTIAYRFLTCVRKMCPLSTECLKEISLKHIKISILREKNQIKAHLENDIRPWESEEIQSCNRNIKALKYIRHAIKKYYS